MTLTLDVINALDEPGFVAALGDVCAHAPWAAARAWASRPFATVAALHMALFNAVRGQAPAARLAFFNAHAGLDAALVTPAERARMGQLCAAYRSRFGFPFILCARLHDSAGILRALEQRLKRDLASERDATMHETFLTIRQNLADRIQGASGNG